MANGAVSEVGAGGQGGAAPVAILHGTQPAQGKFGSLQDFWAILGSHGMTASEATKTASETPVAKGAAPVAPIPRPTVPASAAEEQVVVAPKVVSAAPMAKAVPAVSAEAVKATTVAAPEKKSSDGDTKKTAKTTEGEAGSQQKATAQAALNTTATVPAMVAPVPIPTSGESRAGHDAASSSARRGVSSSGSSSGSASGSPSRIPDGLVTKLDGTSGAASVVGKAEAVAAGGTNSGTGHGGESAKSGSTTVPVPGSVLGGISGTESVPVFSAAMVPALEQSVASHGAAGHSGTQTGIDGAAGESDAVSGYGGSSGFSEPRTMVANANVLEVGLTGGAHDGLRVRAELGHTGEVTASLVASNAGSAQSLDKQLGAMADYLKTEAVAVGSLTVTASEKSAGTDVSGGTGGGGFGADAGGGSGGASGRGEDARNSQNFTGWMSDSTANGVDERISGMVQAMASGDTSAASVALGSGVGGWLNVRV